MGFAHRTENYSGQENDPKLWETEEPDMAASGSFVIWLYIDIARPEN